VIASSLRKPYLALLRTIILISILSAAGYNASAAGWEMYDAGDKANRLGHYEEAIVLLTDAISSDHLFDVQLASAHFSRAFAYRSIGEYQKALSDYQKALENQPSLSKDSYFHNALSQAYIGLGDYDRADEAVERALALAPESASFFNTRGMIRRKQKKYNEALSDYRHALEISPGYWKANAEMAWLLATCPDDQIRDGARAVELAASAARVKPEPSTLDALGAAYAEVGRFDDAVKMMGLAIELLDQFKRDKLIDQLRPRMAVYMEHKPWRE
jgi:tetratricopeptide (TPR) repeat protein